MSKHTKNKEILRGAMVIAITKDSRTPYEISKKLGINKAQFYRMKNGELFPGVEIFLKLKDWMQGLDIDLEKMIRAN